MSSTPPDRDFREVALRGTLLGWRSSGATRWIGLDGVSMRPLIEPGASALVDFARTAPDLGHVVLADAGGRLVVHRVVAAPTRRRPGRWVLKGDGEPYPDPTVSAEDIYGTVRAIRNHPHDISSGGLSGRRARLIARVSRLSTRALRSVISALAFLPPDARRPIGRALATLARLPVLIVAITPRAGGKIAIQRKGGES